MAAGHGAGGAVRGVVRRHNSPCIEAMFERARQRIFGATLAKKDVRGLLRSLQAGEWVVYSADQDFNYQHALLWRTNDFVLLGLNCRHDVAELASTTAR